MEAIRGNLIQKGLNTGVTYTVEQIPSRQTDGQMYAFLCGCLLGLTNINRVWHLSPKQDHLVCFLGGSLMLGATTTGANFASVSTPPLASELTETGQKDWILGTELINTCMDTHKTAT
jgi:mannosyl-oligosaccharide alpha-1,2-mannosidase